MAGGRGELRNGALAQPLRSTQPPPRWASVSPSEQGVAARVPEGSFPPEGGGSDSGPCFCSVSVWSEASPSLSHSPHVAHGPGSGLTHEQLCAWTTGVPASQPLPLSRERVQGSLGREGAPGAGPTSRSPACREPPVGVQGRKFRLQFLLSLTRKPPPHPLLSL